MDHSTAASGKNQTDVHRLRHVLRVGAQREMAWHGVFLCCQIPALTLTIKTEKSVCVADEITPGLTQIFTSLTYCRGECFEYL
jgi:hypothetical protein